ncbi:uncharacterized protein LOC126681657 [Mercurialis annua]|uniref:uncharacterized protein LOC126681657 n=1 Tax=Mercurialis annua TaxID=3986 RepID=UPI00215EE971|nr:uncharacterized protein LOC126681657 [Mercurialis annua]
MEVQRSNNNNGNNFGNRPQHPLGFQPQRNSDEGSKLDKALERLEWMELESRQKDKNHASTIDHLETQISQLATTLQGRAQGGLPSTMETNPREQLKAVELRSGKTIEKSNDKRPRIEEDEPIVVEDIASSSKEFPRVNEEVVIEEPYVRPPPPPPFVPKFHKFLEIFKKLQINLSLADALRKMPQYAKFLKDIIMNKRIWEKDGIISLTESWSFTISCTIGNMNSINCLCDLSASINLMPLFLFRTFGDQPVKRTLMVLPLADHSLKKQYGLVEDVLVKVDKFIFPVDFVFLHYAVDKECPMILGRPLSAKRATTEERKASGTIKRSRGGRSIGKRICGRRKCGS